MTSSTNEYYGLLIEIYGVNQRLSLKQFYLYLRRKKPDNFNTTTKTVTE